MKIKPGLVLVGQIDPDGPYQVTVELDCGEIHVHARPFDTESAAEALAGQVRKAGEINLDHWSFWRTRYGSKAFVVEEQEAHHWAMMVRDGRVHLDDVPEGFRTLL